MQRELIVIAGPDAGRSFPLENGQRLVIGRGQASNTQINDPRMSRVDCQVEIDGDSSLTHRLGDCGRLYRRLMLLRQRLLIATNTIGSRVFA
ncbi:MAG: hypothetical protein H8E44_24190 [Planctomycetes bacterium]|nr:hypothetical protein [Planctomycetota bacterium]MBL7039889.1 hypothetical protein [Pirellulaceae bacterium]